MLDGELKIGTVERYFENARLDGDEILLDIAPIDCESCMLPNTDSCPACTLPELRIPIRLDFDADVDPGESRTWDRPGCGDSCDFDNLQTADGMPVELPASVLAELEENYIYLLNECNAELV